MLRLLLLLLVGAASPNGHPYRFDEFRAEGRLEKAPARPLLTTPRARRFRTVLRDAAKEGPNFNGHYRVEWWGCGTNCIEWGVIDLGSGEVWLAPGTVGSCWFADEWSQSRAPDWFELRRDSSLLIQHECRSASNHQTFDTTNYFAWKRGRMVYLSSERLRY